MPPMPGAARSSNAGCSVMATGTATNRRVPLRQMEGPPHWLVLFHLSGSRCEAFQ
jgi:hypothetical protein